MIFGANWVTRNAMDAPLPEEPPPALVHRAVAHALGVDTQLRDRYPRHVLLDDRAIRLVPGQSTTQRMVGGGWRFVASACLTVPPDQYERFPQALCVTMVVTCVPDPSPDLGFMRVAHRITGVHRAPPEAAFGIVSSAESAPEGRTWPAPV